MALTRIANISSSRQVQPVAPTHLIEQASERLEVRLGIRQARLALDRNVDEEGHRQSRPPKRVREANLGVLERDDLSALRGLRDVGLVEDLATEDSAAGERHDLSVREVGERFESRHARDELAEDDEVLRAARDELVDEVLEDDPHRTRHGSPTAVELTGEGRETCVEQDQFSSAEKSSEKNNEPCSHIATLVPSSFVLALPDERASRREKVMTS